MARVVNLYKEPYDVYIGRPGKGRSGYFGNPIVAGKPCPMCRAVHDAPGATLPCYRTYLDARLRNDRRFQLKALTLRDAVLGCFCKPKPCHGDILCEFIHAMITAEWSAFVALAVRVHGVSTSSDEGVATSVTWNGRTVGWDKIAHRAYIVASADAERRWVAPWTNTLYRALFAMGEFG